MKQWLIDVYADEFDGLLFADGFDAAILGIDEASGRIIYSIRRCIEILTEEMSEEDALEYFSFNVSGSFVGDKTPIWCQDYGF